jgi:hypothetical protein
LTQDILASTVVPSRPPSLSHMPSLTHLGVPLCCLSYQGTSTGMDPAQERENSKSMQQLQQCALGGFSHRSTPLPRALQLMHHKGVLVFQEQVLAFPDLRSKGVDFLFFYTFAHPLIASPVEHSQVDLRSPDGQGLFP